MISDPSHYQFPWEKRNNVADYCLLCCSFLENMPHVLFLSVNGKFTECFHLPIVPRHVPLCLTCASIMFCSSAVTPPKLCLIVGSLIPVDFFSLLS